MKKIFKGIYTFLIVILVGYIIYRNIKLGTVPSASLIKDEHTLSLYNHLLPNTDNKSWVNYYYSQKDLSVEDIPVDMKYNIAFRSMGTGESIILENKFRESYEKIFGKNSYKSVASFYGGCSTYTYNASKQTYEKTINKSCDAKDISILSKIVDASQSDSSMTITVVIAYIHNTKKEVYKTCNKDLTDCKDVLFSGFDKFDEADLDYKKYKLDKYVFTFDAIGDEYYFSHMRKE
ncbi:MAG: hypothetical protein HFJ38_01195 [Bacilli bacterium]|nr:hypothetical protein [Bacilli bacterium]